MLDSARKHQSTIAPQGGAVDHFSRLGLPRSPTIDGEDLERRYLLKSREVHPDLNGDDPGSLVASAALNDAFRVLSNPWKRYTYLAELWSQGVMEANKTLCPMFLAEALELFEDVEATETESSRQELRGRIERQLSERERDIQCLLQSPAGAHDAAVKCHEARYLMRALERLDETTEPVESAQGTF